MIVVSDSSPLVALLNIELAELLPKLFRVVVIPPQIAAELAGANRPPQIQRFIASPPAWLVTRGPSRIEAIPDIHVGERAAISLALELGADLLLMDERDGRRAAKERKLAVTGTVGVLERAARDGLIDLGDAFERLKRTDFWISARLLDTRLAEFRQRQQP